MLPWLLLWSICLLFWHVFLGRISLEGLAFGAVCSAVAVVAARVVLAQHLAPLRTRFGLLLQAWRLPKLIVTDAWEVLAVLGRQVFLRQPAESLLFSVPFDAGRDDDESAFRRALAVGYTTSTPSFVVVGIDREKGLLVYHQIRKSEVPEMTRRLGAQP